MLVLSRKRNEAIRIGSDVLIRVIDVRGDRVRLGIEAPSTLSVHREEVYQRILVENQAAEAGDRPPSGALLESRFFVECA